MNLLMAAITAWYLGASGDLQLAQGGGDMRRLGGAGLRAGAYVAELLAVEGDVAIMENHACVGVNGLWHWWGYERLDPFFTFGARGWLNGGDVGPMGGIGTFYHLDRHWSLRADIDATLGLERKAEMIYGFSVGLQYEF